MTDPSTTAVLAAALAVDAQSEPSWVFMSPTNTHATDVQQATDRSLQPPVMDTPQLALGHPVAILASPMPGFITTTTTTSTA